MQFSAPAAPFGADELLAIWQTSSARHLAFGGCACGIDGVVLRLDDFETDIVDYLLDEARRHERSDVADLIEREARRPDDAWSVGALLTALSVGLDVNENARTFLLVRLGRTLGSFADTHGAPRRFEAS